MKKIKKILLVIGIILIFGILIALDIADRNIIYTRHIPEKEINEFYNYETFDEQKKAYKKNYGKSEWRFPKKKVEKIKLYENKPLISRLTSKTLSKKNKTKVLEFVNNPKNFDWSETTWKLNAAEYILRFFDNKNTEIGKIWICIDDCGMIKSIPFSPNMKFGGLNTNGRKKIAEILNGINK